jgi:YD repeat-containing protein
LKTLIPISFLLTTVCSFGQTNDEYAFFEGTYSKDYIRKHRIRTVTKTSYMDTNKLSTTIFYFDKNGFLQKQSILNSNGVERSRFLFKFSKYGDLTQRITLPEKDYRADTFVVKREYNKNKVIKESSSYSPLTTEHFYNKKGDIIRTVHPYNNGHITLSKRIIDNEYDEAGNLVHVTDRIYNDSSDKIEQWMSDRTITFVGEKIQKVVERITNGDIATNKGNVEYSYDSFGNLISIVSDAVVSRYFTYDNEGLLKSKREKFPEGFDTLSDAKIIAEYTYTFRR